jgi:hypothetical protein
MKKLLPALFLLFLSLFSSAQIFISGGNVGGFWRESLSPYIIDGDIEVPDDSILIIEPGVEIRFNGFYQFIVHGNLRAVGTEQDSIRFTTSDTIMWWHGLKYYNITGDGKDTCMLKYCRMEKGKTTGASQNVGGGAICTDHSDKIKIENCLLCNNFASNGGGIFVNYGCPIIKNCIIRDNESDQTGSGGGIGIEVGAATISGCEILNNHAWRGGGISIHGSEASIENSVIRGNSDHIMAGGILSSYGTGPTCKNVLIENNSSGGTGGIEILYSEIWLEYVTIRHNWGEYTGGIYIGNFADLHLSMTNLCNIYMNYSFRFQDISSYDVVGYLITLDTFTVMQPDEFLVKPSNFDYDIRHSFVGQQTASNLYISPDGSDTNSGLTSTEPMKTLGFAVRKVISNEDNPHTIFMGDGTYSNTLTGEYFPIILKSNINVSAINSQQVILDAEDKTSCMALCEKSGVQISKLRIINGASASGGGISVTRSNMVEIDNCLLSNNYASEAGGGMWLLEGNHIKVTNCEFINNYSSDGAGCKATSELSLIENCSFINNISDENGGGISIAGNPTNIVNCLFVENKAVKGGAIYTDWYNSRIINNTFHDNEATYKGGTIYCISSNCELINSIIWDDSVLGMTKIYLTRYGESGYFDFTVNHCDLMNGSNCVQVVDDFINLHWEESNISSDPFFMSPSVQNFLLIDNSPCINTGTPDVTTFNLPEMDLAGNLRIVNDTIDMGCYENQFCVGIKQIKPPSDFLVYPNPNDGHFFITHSDRISTLTVYDLMGKTIISDIILDKNPYKVSLNDINPGLYILEIKSSDGSLISKIIVKKQGD